jgi:hypothetical protein
VSASAQEEENAMPSDPLETAACALLDALAADNGNTDAYFRVARTARAVQAALDSRAEERAASAADREIAERAREWAKLLDAMNREEDDYARGSIWNGAEEAKRALLAAVRKHQEAT